LQTLSNAVTGSKMNPNHDDIGRFAPADASRVNIPADAAYMYHGTSHYNALDIADSGTLATHKPSYGTDQSTWPDGSTEKRSYWTHDPQVARNFYPEDGTPTLLRAPRSAIPFKRESTGDHYHNKPIAASHLEYFAGDGWRKLLPGAKMNPNHDNLGRFATGPGNEVNPVGHGTPREKLARLEALTAVNLPTVTALTEKIDRTFGTHSEVSVKKSENILSKATRPDILAEKPWFGVEHIRDSLRFKTIVDSFAAVKGIVAQLEESGDAKIIKYDSGKLTDPKEWGWRMLPIDMQMQNGQMVEYYILSKEQAEVAKQGHVDFFEKWRNVKRADMSPAQVLDRAKDVAASSKLNGDAWNRYLARTGQTESDVRASVTRA
jgi:hypothetical protein